VHAASLAKSLGIKKILVPRGSSIFCALGSVIADLRHDFVKSIIARSSQVDSEFLQATFDEMEGSGNEYLDQEGIPANDRYSIKSMDMRYKGQFHEVEVQVSENEADFAPEAIASLEEKFNNRHEELYAYRDTVETEIINLRLAAYGTVVKPARKEQEFVTRDAAPHIKSTRSVYFEEEEAFVPTPIYDGDTMEIGNRVEGPAIIEQRTTTIVVPPKTWLEVTSYGDYLMHLPD
jgi:N-methylhydantoinase A